MRPALLNPLFAAVSSLPGVGPKTGKLFDRLLRDGEPARLVDLLFHLPHSGIDRSFRPRISEAPRDQIVTFEAVVVEHRPPKAHSKAPYRVLVEDDTGDVQLIFFLANHQWVERALPLGETRWISGQLELDDGHLQMVHPDRVLDAAALAARISYTRVSSPEPVTQQLGAALAHVFNHQTHHRGQAHAVLTGLVGTAPELDLLFYQRLAEAGRA